MRIRKTRTPCHCIITSIEDRTADGHCKICRNLWYKSDRRKQPEKYILKAVRKRSKEMGTFCDLCKDDIIIPKECPILKIPLFIGDNAPSDNSPSIDRIDNSKGYTKDNIIIISYRANTIKNSAS